MYNYLLKTGSLVNAIQDFLLAQPLWYMSQYTIISKYGKRTRQLKFKKELKNFPSRNKGGQRKWLCTGVEWKESHWAIRKRNTGEHEETHKLWHESISR